MAERASKILVLLREVRDPRPPVRLATGGANVSEVGVRWVPNPADLAALEVAVGLAESKGAQVTALAVGPEPLDDLLRAASAMGASRILRVWDECLSGADAAAEARLLARVLEIEQPSLFFTGSRLLDKGDDPAAAFAASLSGIPYTTAALSIVLAPGTADVSRKAARGGRQRVSLPLPCAVLFDAAAAAHRYPDLDAMLSSLEAPLEVWGLPELGLPAGSLGYAGALLRPAGVGFPRPDPLRVPTPDARLPGHERVNILLSGGIRARAGRMHVGDAAGAAARILQIFAEEGLVDLSGRAQA